MKKRLVLVSAAVCFIITSHAQIRKGSVLLGGSIGWQNHEIKTGNSETRTNSFMLSPAVGITIKDNWVVGLSTGLSQYKVKPTSISQKEELNAFSAGIFARRYAPLSKNFYLFGNAKVSYNHLNREEIIGTDYIKNTTSKGFTIGIMPGIIYAVSKRFHLEASLNDLFTASYSKMETETTTLSGHAKNHEKNFDVQTNLNPTAPLTIGFRFVLGK